MSFFHENSCSQTYGIFLKSTRNHEMSICNELDTCFYLICIVISKEHLQRYIWVVPLLFQETTCSDQVLPRVLRFFETSSRSDPFYSKVSILFAIPGASINWINKPFLSQKGNCSHAAFSNLLCLCRTGIVVKRCDKNNYDTSLFSGMYILKEVYYMTTSIPAIHFFMVVSLFHGSTWVDPYVKDTVFISQHLLQPFIIRSGLWLIRENLKGMIVWWKPLKITVVLLF